MSPTLLLLTLLACDDGAHLRPGGSSDDTGELPDAGAFAVACELDPVPEYELTTLRVGPDGAVYGADVGGVLYRYERVDDGAGCSLEGVAIWDQGGLDTVTDFDLDADGKVYALIFYSGLAVLSPAGDLLFECEIPAGHGIAVTSAGDRLYSVSIGDEALSWVEIEDQRCIPVEQGVSLPQAIGTAPSVDGDLLAVDSHDPSSTLAPGVLIDPSDGSMVQELGLGTAGDGEELVAISDLLPTGDGYWAAGSPGGDLWHIASDGDIDGYYDVEGLLPVAGDPDPTLSLHSVAYGGDDPSYLSAGFIDVQGVWTMDLTP